MRGGPVHAAARALTFLHYRPGVELKTFSKISAYIRLPINLVGLFDFIGQIGANGQCSSIFVGVQAGYLTILSALSNFERPQEN
jgi:hypothetical protein